MEKNIGKMDKRIRLLTGVIMILVGAYMNSVWGVLGMIPVITADFGICPLYGLFHISTIPKTKKSNSKL